MIGNKFFKSKTPATGNCLKSSVTKETVVEPKIARSSKRIKEKESRSPNYSPVLRQTKLSESFVTASVRTRLRPRNKVKKYNDLSIIDQSISPDKRNSMVLMERLEQQNAGKAPVYQGIRLSDKYSKDRKSSIYEFEFQDDDPCEKRVVKTKKKRSSKKPTTTKKQTIGMANAVPAKETDPMPPDPMKDSRVPDNRNKLHTELLRTEDGKVNDVMVVLSKESTASTIVPLQVDAPPMTGIENKTPGPKVSQIQVLTGAKKINFKPNSTLPCQHLTKFNPFRATQSIFKSRPTLDQNDMTENSLLNKSVSPIKTDVHHFDAASPWRPSVPDTFLSVKHLVQSTPSLKRDSSPTVRPGLARCSSVLGQARRIAKKVHENNENAISSTSVNIENNSPVINHANRYPLGVWRTDMENILAGSSSFKEMAPSFLQESTNSSVNRSLSRGENRDNSSFGDRLYKSPVISEKNGAKEGNKKNFSPSISLAVQRKESVDENLAPVDENRTLRQSNLHNFLSLDEIPESTRINTSHGIFGDAHSTPIIKSQARQISTTLNVQNYFGFDDDYSEIQDSSLKFDEKQEIPVKKVSQQLGARVSADMESPKTGRMSLEEIKNTLYPRKDTKSREVQNRKAMITKKAKTIMGWKPAMKSVEVPYALQFSDTFDVLSESRQLSDESSLAPECALFTDLEPVHFTKPPRWSYTKKRVRNHNYSFDEKENDNDDLAAPVIKKKKVARLNKMEEKKIDEWVKSVNETFQEIEDFDLVVEKLP